MMAALMLAMALPVASPPDCPPDGIDTAAAFRVRAGPRVPFFDTPDCTEASCRRGGSYIVAGDRVVVYRREGRRACVLFDRTREITGWIDADRLEPDAAAARAPLVAWAGDWYDGDDHIRFRVAGAGRLHVEGDAYWPSAHPADRPYGPNIGSLSGTFPVRGDRLDYSDGPASYDCRATLRLVGDYLLVDDNGSCGGMNVRFTGTYRRRASAHRPATRS